LRGVSIERDDHRVFLFFEDSRKPPSLVLARAVPRMRHRAHAVNLPILRWMLALLFSLVLVPASSAAGESPVTVQFLARGLESSSLSAGHVFMLVTVETKTGPAKEVYGFYPRKGGLSVVLGAFGKIKGSGMLKSEYRCSGTDDCNATQAQIDKWSKDPDSTTISIKMSQLNTIMHDVNQWNSASYRLTQNNCMDFVGTVVTDLGFPAPKRSLFQTPKSYLHDLHLAVQKEMSERAEKEREAREEQVRIEAARRVDVSGYWIDNHGNGFQIKQSGDNLHFAGPARAC